MQKIKDVMKKDVITVKRSTTFGKLLHIFKDFHSFPLVPVVDDNGKLEGIVSLPSLIKAFAPQHLGILKTLPLVNRIDTDIFDLDVELGIENLIIVDDIMERRFVKLKEELSIEEAHREMELNSRDILPVVDEKDKLVGLIGKFDIVMQVFKNKGIIE